jgi:pimeloyl-ACP methyl ester carboxylesterase
VDSLDTVDAGGHRITYERKGEGPPLVLLHGYVGDRGMWRPQIDGLSDEFTVVAWDAPGFGGSSDPPETFRLSDFADCLAAFIDALGLERPHVAGLSFGGGLALELYRRHPSLPRTLVLASAYAGWAGSLPAELAPSFEQPRADQPPGASGSWNSHLRAVIVISCACWSSRMT